MKRRLHECLRDTLVFEVFDAPPEDSLEPLPAEYRDARAREQKRQRVQKIAENYLQRGQVPVLLSTRLRGPFTGLWANPWQARETRAPKVKRGNTGSGRRKGERGGERGSEEIWLARAECSVRRRNGVVKVAVLEKEETENAYDTPVEERQRVRERRVKKRDTVQVDAQGTGRRRGPMLEEGHTKHSRNISRQPGSDDMRYSDDQNAGDPIQSSSPSQPSRNKGPHFDTSPERFSRAAVANDNFQSSYSAPMMISSSATVTPGPRVGIAEAPEEPDNDTFVTAEQSLEPPDSIIPTTPKPPPPPFMRRISSCNVVCMAERCVDAAASPAQKSSKRKKTKEKTPWTGDDSAVEMHTGEQCPAAAAPLSFSGSFTYRKVGKGKGARVGKKKSPPKPMDFGSSPVAQRRDEGEDQVGLLTRKEGNGVLKNRQEQGTEDGLVEAELAQAGAEDRVPEATVDLAKKVQGGDNRSHESVNGATNTANGADDDTITAEEPKDAARRESGSSRQSMYSTQAAFMLAQMEFQEDTFRSPFNALPSIGGDTPRLQTPNGQLNNTTPKSIFREPGPAITPFHAFNTELDRTHHDSVCTVEMSTQELFAAASPFAPSTVKKVKTTAPIRPSSLRFSVPYHEDTRDKFAYFQDARSFTPSTERVPLKDRNSLGAYRSPYDMASQKSMRLSQPLAFSPPFGQKEISSVPKLSFSGSIDGGLTFADQFLRNLEEMT